MGTNKGRPLVLVALLAAVVGVASMTANHGGHHRLHAQRDRRHDLVAERLERLAGSLEEEEEEGRFDALKAELKTIGDHLIPAFPYHGQEHLKTAAAFASEMATKFGLDPEVLEVAMLAHDIGYEQAAELQGYRPNAIDFNAAPSPQAVPTKGKDKDGKEIDKVAKLGTNHEEMSSKQLLDIIHLMKKDRPTTEELDTVLTMISATEMVLGFVPKDLKKTMWTGRLETLSSHTQGDHLKEDAIAAIVSEGRYQDAVKIAEAADFAYFYNHLKDRKQVICHSIAVFVEFYVYGGVVPNTSPDGVLWDKRQTETKGFLEQWKQFVNGQSGFRDFVWLPKMREVLPEEEANHLEALDGVFIAALKLATRSLAKDIETPCQLYRGLKESDATLGSVADGDYILRHAMRDYLRDSECLKHRAFRVCPKLE